ncbi:MAG: serine/threonine-protein kinase [Planctomycetota bacterium]
MTPEQWQRVRELFHAALEQPPEARLAFVAGQEEDDDLRRLVRELLREEPGSERFLEPPTPPELLSEPIQFRSGSWLIGRRLGAYRVEAEVATGGMGTVFRAVRADGAYEQEVAIKLIRPELASPLLRDRFLAERQALAQLQHPYITRLLDGATTADGLPYFVMELVEGRPITRYCEEKDLSRRERIDLFRRVCEAVQHAHQSLVLHRDLKPSNILVTEDGTPKLLDFGISKLIQEPMDGEPDTQAPTLIGAMTPEYASPEQRRRERVTTASDLYSLGVVLHEILTGRRPDQPIVAPEHELRGDLALVVSKALHEEPERRYASVEQLRLDLGSAVDGLPVLASPDSLPYRAKRFLARHRIGVSALALVILSLAAGIVGLAVGIAEADRERLRAERRALEAEDARRDAKTQAEAAAAAREEALDRERVAQLQAKRAERILGLLSDLLLAGDPLGAPEPDLTVLEALDRASSRLENGELAEDPPSEAVLRSTLGLAYFGLGAYERAEGHLRAALETQRGTAPPDVLATTLNNLAGALYQRGELEESRDLLDEGITVAADLPSKLADLKNTQVQILRALSRFEEAEELQRQVLETFDTSSSDDATGWLSYRQNLAQILQELGRPKEAREMFESILAEARELEPRQPLLEASLLTNLSGTLVEPSDAEESLQQALDIYRAHLRPDHPYIAHVRNNLASQALRRGDFTLAREGFEEARALFEKAYGEEHPSVALVLNNLGQVARQTGDPETARELYRRALDIRRATLPDDHPSIEESELQLGLVCEAVGDDETAVSLLESWLRRGRQASSLPSSLGIGVRATLARAYSRTGRKPTAEGIYKSAIAEAEEKLPPGHLLHRSLLEELLRLYEDWPRPEEAALIRERLER